MRRCQRCQDLKNFGWKKSHPKHLAKESPFLWVIPSYLEAKSVSFLPPLKKPTKKNRSQKKSPLQLPHFISVKDLREVLTLANHFVCGKVFSERYLPPLGPGESMYQLYQVKDVMEIKYRKYHFLEPTPNWSWSACAMILLLKLVQNLLNLIPPIMKTTAANSHGVWKFASRFSVDSHHFSASKQWILGHSLAAIQPFSKVPAFWSTAFFSCSIHCLTLTSLQNPSSSPLSLEKSQQFKRHDWFTQKSLRKFPSIPVVISLTLTKIYETPINDLLFFEGSTQQRHLEALPGVPGNLWRQVGGVGGEIRTQLQTYLKKHLKGSPKMMIYAL